MVRREFSRVLAGATAEEALAGFTTEVPGVILLDAAFPSAETVAQALVRAVRQCQLIVLAIEEKVETVIEWAKLGAAGYVPRRASVHQLLDTVKGVIRGEQACAPAVTSRLDPAHFEKLPRRRAMSGFRKRPTHDA